LAGQPVVGRRRGDAASNTVAEHVEPSEPLSGGSVLVTDDAVWVSAYDDNRVLRLARG
jgi:hypothetical protein